MARPTKNEKDKQVKKYNFALYQNEVNLFDKFELTSGAKIRDYVIKSLKNEPIIIYEKDTKELNYLIKMVGINVNQIAKKANSNNITSLLDYNLLKKEIENMKEIIINYSNK